jgi:hypothetical protein
MYYIHILQIADQPIPTPYNDMKAKYLLPVLMLTALFSTPVLMAQDAKPWYFGEPPRGRSGPEI